MSVVAPVGVDCVGDVHGGFPAASKTTQRLPLRPIRRHSYGESVHVAVAVAVAVNAHEGDNAQDNEDDNDCEVHALTPALKNTL